MQGRVHEGEVRAEPTAIKRGRADRAPARGGAWRAPMKVGNGVAVDEAQGRVAPEELHHARGMREIAPDAHFIEAFTEFGPQVTQGHVQMFMDTGLPGQRVSRYPHPSARPRAGAPYPGRFLGHDDPQAQMGCGDRGGQPAGARPHHQQVTVCATLCPVRCHWACHRLASRLRQGAVWHVGRWGGTQG